MGLDSQLARFATEGKCFKKDANDPEKDIVKPKLFRPTKKLELSVFRIADETETDLIEEGKKVVRSKPLAHSLYGWADISTKQVLTTGLGVDDDDNPPGHSTITGWPAEEEKWLGYQQQLAEVAVAVRLPQPIPVADSP